MDSPEGWRWIWLVAAVVFAAGEMATPGSFFLLFFALGALVAAVGEDRGVGAQRLVGQTGTVLREIPGAGELGLVRVDREEWRAESLDGSPIPPGAAVKVADIQGTRVLVSPVGQITSPSEGADL
jgi:membrane protein implicated in regulation of membrane protease activity